METVIECFDKIPLIAPVVNGNVVKVPYDKFDNMSSYCGAGKGIGDFIIPEKVLGLSISVSCFYHDISWDFSEPTWEAFHASNSKFLSNTNSIIRVKSNNITLEHLRYYRAVTYHNAVNTLGAYFFWKLKREQGYTGKLGWNIIPPSLKQKTLANRLNLIHSWIKN